MQETKKTKGVHFKSIGKTDNLQTVSCRAEKPTHVSYTSRKLSNDRENAQVQVPYLQDPEKNTKHNKQSANNSKLPKQGGSFWPTDIIVDKTGKVLSQFRSYIQTHKINSYIKLNLPQYQGNVHRSQAAIVREEKKQASNENFTNQNRHKTNKINREDQNKQYLTNQLLRQKLNEERSHKASTQSHKDQQRETNSSCSSRNRNKRVIIIDYKVIQVEKTNRKRRISEGYIHDAHIIHLNNDKKGEDIKKGHNKVYIESEGQRELKANHIDQKQQFTPNTSIHIRTLNSVDKHPSTDRNNSRKR